MALLAGIAPPVDPARGGDDERLASADERKLTLSEPLLALPGVVEVHAAVVRCAGGDTSRGVRRFPGCSRIRPIRLR